MYMVKEGYVQVNQNRSVGIMGGVPVNAVDVPVMLTISSWFIEISEWQYVVTRNNSYLLRGASICPN